MITFDSVLSAAQQLSADDRQKLIDALWDMDTNTSEEPLDPAWDDELARRIKEIEADPSKTVAWETIQERIRANAKKYE